MVWCIFPFIWSQCFNGIKKKYYLCSVQLNDLGYVQIHEQICRQVKALGDTPEGIFNLHTVLKPSKYSAEELMDEYLSDKYGV